MKAIIIGAMLGFMGVASAGTLTQLQQPANVPVSGYNGCVGAAVSTDGNDTISGYCQNMTQRSCVRVNCVYTYSLYTATWDQYGNTTGDVLCGAAVVGVKTTYTYQSGFTAANCVPAWKYFAGSPGVQDILIGNQWYAYVTTAADGSFES